MHLFIQTLTINNILIGVWRMGKDEVFLFELEGYLHPFENVDKRGEVVDLDV